MPSETPQTPLLRPGETCWRIERANRLGVIIDAADYFSTVRDAVRAARHTVMLIGWDFDTRIRLDRPDRGGEGPNTLGRFLNWCVEQQPELRIYMLRWDLGAMNSFGRGATPLAILDWMTNERIRFKLDGAHPAGSAHHQKIVVIDDTLAFCGGIDITADRWDNREHLDEHPERVRPTTRRQYGPWHDVSTAVDGDAARALGDLARERWKRATGEDLAPPPSTACAWPEGLTPTLRDVDVAISRTIPEQPKRPAVHEIESLYLAAIGAVRRTLYIESQYFASRKIAEAMARRLRKPDGPEIVVVNPETADGWLEEEVMGSSRAHVLKLIGEADTYDRFRIYTPVTKGGQAIYVHAKVTVVDDRLLRVGSSNFNNRSLGFDTECDLSVEVLPGTPQSSEISQAILGLRNDLVAEHLGVPIDGLEREIARADGSLIEAIDALRAEGRTLVPFEPPELNDIEDGVLRENQMFDPERPSRRWQGLRRGLKRLDPRSSVAAKSGEPTD